MNNIEIRTLKIEDYKSITTLSNQLGSDLSDEIVKKQIKVILANPDHEAFVAEIHQNIIGYIHCFKAIRLTTKPFIEISGLAVDESMQGNGFGKQLVKHIEKLYSKDYVIRVRCNTKRDLAHKFYAKLGYTFKKEQKIFENTYK